MSKTNLKSLHQTIFNFYEVEFAKLPPINSMNDLDYVKNIFHQHFPQSEINQVIKLWPEMNPLAVELSMDLELLLKTFNSLMTEKDIFVLDELLFRFKTLYTKYQINSAIFLDLI